MSASAIGPPASRRKIGDGLGGLRGEGAAVFLANVIDLDLYARHVTSIRLAGVVTSRTTV
jgi:hypothetical protein